MGADGALDLNLCPYQLLSRPVYPLVLFHQAHRDAARPTPTPKPERRKKVRRSSVGNACARPRRKLCTNGDAEAPDAPEFFLVNNMRLSRRGEC
jgi:hypothetical protein